MCQAPQVLKILKTRPIHLYLAIRKQTLLIQQTLNILLHYTTTNQCLYFVCASGAWSALFYLWYVSALPAIKHYVVFCCYLLVLWVFYSRSTAEYVAFKVNIKLLVSFTFNSLVGSCIQIWHNSVHFHSQISDIEHNSVQVIKGLYRYMTYSLCHQSKHPPVIILLNASDWWVMEGNTINSCFFGAKNPLAAPEF